MNLLTKFSVGQYVHGNRSWLRIIDSRLKIIIVMIFLITPIWAGPIWRLSLVGFLLLITFLSLLPSRVWWRSLFFLSCLSLLIGCISILASSDIQSLDGYLRNPNELQVVLESQKEWNILQIPSQKIWFINFGPYNLSRKAFELGIKTSTLIFTVIHSVNLMLLTTLQEDIVWGLSWFMYPLRKIGLPTSVRSINFRNLGLKKSFNVLLILVEDHGAESLLSKKKIIIKTNRFRTLYPSKSLNVIVNTLSICFICIAIFLRKLYGAL